MSATATLLDDWHVAALEAGAPDGEVPALGSLEWIRAEVPGAVQYDLVREGRLENPFASSEAARQAGWVPETDWCYRTTFSLGAVPPGLSLDVPGVDTFAELWLNGVLVGRSANNYRAYRFPVAGAARVGENELLVRVKAHRRVVADKVEQAKAHLATTSNQSSYRGKSLIRRYQRSFLSGNSSLLNLGAEILGIGLNRPVAVIEAPSTRIERFHFRVVSATPSRAEIAVSADVAVDPAAGAATLEVSLVDPGSGRSVASGSGPVGEGREIVIEVADLKLWWPRGYGEAFRYRLELRVVAGSTVLAAEEALVGIRSVELLRRLPSGRPTFQLVVNGVPVHVRGHNLVPLDYVKVHRSPAEYERVVQLVTASNANLIRIWGGGANEPTAFYDALDEAGVMLWQDFYLHSATYPDYDPDFVEEFRQESLEVVWRLRNHPCLVLLCGGNEQDEGWDEWGWQGDLHRFYGGDLAHRLGAEIAAAAAPELPFIPNSPHGARRSQSPVDGDMHCWGNFYNATKDPTFVTETCWNLQSYSSPATLREEMGLDVDEFGELGWPARWRERTGLALITKLPYSSCHTQRTLRDYLYGLEVEHLLADHHALAMLRLRSPSCRGIVYWPLNKGAPLFEFGCVDYALRPLMNYYGIKRLYADGAIGTWREDNDVRVVGSNLSLRELRGTLTLTHVDAGGKVLSEREEPVTLPPDWCGTIARLPDLYGQVVDRTRELVQASFSSSDGSVRALDTLFFCPVGEFQADPATLEVELRPAGEGTWSVKVAASSVVPLLHLEGDGLLFSDNCFALLPSKGREIGLELLRGEAAGELSFKSLGFGELEKLRLP